VFLGVQFFKKSLQQYNVNNAPKALATVAFGCVHGEKVESEPSNAAESRKLNCVVAWATSHSEWCRCLSFWRKIEPCQHLDPPTENI
jgi:hypothetical protein